MAIFDLFRSKLTHSDPAVRADAVRRLEPDAFERLGRVAKEDTDATVRRLALKRLKDPAILAEIGLTDTDESLRKLARERANDLLIATAVADDQTAAVAALATLTDETALAAVCRDAKHQAIRDAALARLTDTRALSEVAKSAKDAAMRVAAVKRVKSATTLRAIALSDDLEEVVLAAIDELMDAEALEVVAQKAKRKAARKRAALKLGETGQAVAPTVNKQRRAAQRQIVNIAELIASSWEWDKDERRLEEARQQWKDLGSDAAPELDARFKAAWETFYQRRAKAIADRPLIPTAEIRSAPTPKEEIAAPPPSDTPTTAEPATRPHGVAAEHEGEKADRSEKRRLDARKEKDQRDKRLKQLLDLAGQLETLSESKNLGDSVSALRRAQAAVKRLGRLPDDTDRDALQGRIETGIQKLHIKVQELREADEWSRWANVPVREGIITRLEALETEADLAVAAKAMREIEEAWRDAGPVSREQSTALHERYKRAAAKMRVKTRVFFKEKDTERKEHLQQKAALCEKAEALAESTDWKATTEELKRLQAEWKEVGPVPRAQSEALWKRFRAPADAFFARRKVDLERMDGERDVNLKKKEALCERAEALATSTEWEVTASELKHMQADWKAIGPAPRAKADAVWKRFRKSCDTYFERFAKRHDLQRDENLERAEGLCADMERIVATSEILDPELIPGKLAELRASRKAIGPLPEGTAKSLGERFEVAMLAMAERFPQHFRGSDYDLGANQKKRETMCAKAEELAERVEKLRERPSSVASMAEGLREALAANAFREDGKGYSPQREIADERDRLRADWGKLRPLPGEIGATLEQRFKAAMDSLHKVK